MIKLIASDLDGTLLQNDAQALTDRSLDLIEEIVDKGVYFVAASGRQYDNERRMFHRIRDKISYIAENGSVCIHNGKIISLSVIDYDLCTRIIKKVKEDGIYELLVSREESCFIEDNDPAFVNHITNVMKNTTTIIDDMTQLEGPIIKIAICDMDATPESVQAYCDELNDFFGSEIKIVTSGNLWIDFIAPGTNKGHALAELLKVLDVDPQDCIAFGDQYNDMEMLEYVGTSYAMANAVPGVLEQADHVTPLVDDVLEKILKEL